MEIPVGEALSPALPIRTTIPRGLAIYLSALAVVLIAVCCSPNFDRRLVNRTAPLGSDFLQEWTGGYIWRSSDRSKLYHADHFRVVQHKPDIVGFTWNPTSYYPMVYPPFYYMAVSPLSLLPYDVAIFVWLAMLGLVTGLTIDLWTRCYEPASQSWGWCLAAVLAFYPFLYSINTGHKSIFLLLIFSATLLLIRQRRMVAAGFVFGLVAFKPHLGLVIGLAMLCKCQWRFVGGCVISVGLLIGLSFLSGFNVCRDYFVQCSNWQHYATAGGYDLYQAHNLSAAVKLLVGTTGWASLWLTRFLQIAVILLIARLLRGRIVTDSTRFSLQYAGLVFATVLLSPHFYVYDLTILLLPIGILLQSLRIQTARLETATQSRFCPRLTARLLTVGCAALFLITPLSACLANLISVQPTVLIMLFMISVLCYHSAF